MPLSSHLNTENIDTKTILVVEDDQHVQMVLKDTLEAVDFKVTVASDGKEALKLVDMHDYDLIITDLIMPEVEGIELIITLKKSQPDLPVLAISGAGPDLGGSYLNLAKSIGAHATIQKPFEMDNVIETATRLINGEK